MSVVTGGVQATAGFVQTPATGPLSGVNLALNTVLSSAFKNGTAADLVNLIYVNTLSLAAATQTLDLTSLTDVLGNAITFGKVRFLAVKNLSQTGGQTVAVGNSGTNEWDAFLSAGGTVLVHPSTAGNPDGGFLVLTSPNGGAVVDSTHKTLKLDPGANTISVVVVIAGTT